MTTRLDLIIDTDILIDAGRGVPEAVAYVQAKEQQYILLLPSSRSCPIHKVLRVNIACRRRAEAGRDFEAGGMAIGA
jgi:hypothetical protein